jgi:hypothetical protein
MRTLWLAAALLCGLLASARAPAAETDDRGSQWKPTDRSMAELISSGYELVTVLPSGQPPVFSQK